MTKLENKIFKSTSTTFFRSSRFFPTRYRQDVTLLYSFLRVVDNLVDKPKPNSQAVNKIYKAWKSGNTKSLSGTYKKVVENIFYLSEKYKFKPEWIEAFFNSMKCDLSPRTYKTLDDILEYTYGSAEVVGLMLCRIFDLPKSADKYAVLQGRAWQWGDFIRDISEDNKLHRSYFPQEDLKKFGLKDLKKSSEKFDDFVKFQIKRYRKWQNEAYKGYKYIPRRLRIPISLADKKYRRVVNKIYKTPSSALKAK